MLEMPSAEGRRKTSRSINGCWTCRLRRKKCDEQRPSCAICLSHNLICDGYNEKPADMDGSTREAAYVGRLKEAVHQSMSRRKRRCSQKRPSMSSATLTSKETTPETSSCLTSDDLSDLWLSINDTYTPSNIMLDGGVVATGTLLDSGVCESFTQFTLDQLGFLTDTLGGDRTVDSVPPQGDMTTIEGIDDQVYISNATDVEPRHILNTDHRSARHQSAAILYYLERGFEQQFGASPGELADQKALVLELLLYSERFRLVTSTLSRLQIMMVDTTKATTEIMQEESLCPDYSELYHSIESSLLKDSQLGGDALPQAGIIEPLFCILQDLYVQLYRGDLYGRLDRLHLVSNILHRHSAALNIELSHDDCPNQLQRGAVSITNTKNYSSQSMSFLVSAFIVFDITASASLNRKPVLENHENLITQHTHMIETISGCDRHVFLAMLETTKLVLWKHALLAQRNLDVMDLASRASVIKNQLMKCLFRCSTGARSPLTAMFAHATLIYLHVSVSGAHIGLPDLQDHVNAVLSSASDYVSFSSGDLTTCLGKMVWPLCIAGSMAGPQYHTTLQNLIGQTAHGTKTLGSVSSPLTKAKVIMEHCWKVRTLDPYQEISWLDAMQELGLSTVLL